MKVQLERTIASCPDQLRCIVCNQTFMVPPIRTLLCTDTKLIHGDICPNCLKLKEQGIRQRMREQSEQLLQQAQQQPKRSLPLRQQALELLSLSQENLRLPNFFQWFCKRLEIFSQETQELESARLGLNGSCRYGRRSSLRIVFIEDEVPED